MIARGFGLEYLYRDHLPVNVWGLDELCQHCIHAAPNSFIREHSKRLSDITEEEKTPTKSWVVALARYKQIYEVGRCK